MISKTVDANEFFSGLAAIKTNEPVRVHVIKLGRLFMFWQVRLKPNQRWVVSGNTE